MITHAVGLDISADFFTASCAAQDFSLVFFGQNFDQSPEGYAALLAHIASCNIDVKNIAVVMENTGVYSEHISYFLHEQGISVYVEPAHRIKRGFHNTEKTDDIDSRQIAEYFFRFRDKLHPWSPKDEIVQDIQRLLTVREQCVGIQTSLKNALKSQERKHHRREALELRFSSQIQAFKADIKHIDQDMASIISGNPRLKQKVEDILSIGNVGILLTLNLLVITDGFSAHLQPTSLSRYIGICPLQHQSGTSIKKRRKADGAGPERLRKLLYLAAMRMRKNHPEYKKYYERKSAEGKNGRLILNNMANKLLRLICGIVQTGKPYIKDYRSTKPES